MGDSLLHTVGELHFPILALTALVIAYSDHQAWYYFRGTKETLSPKFITWSHRLVWLGLCGMLLTGASLLAPRFEHMIEEPAFLVKIGLVLVLIINAFLIGNLSRLAATTPYAALTPRQQRTLMLSGVVSLTGWVGAFLIGAFFL